jgi:hypothetical protein
MSVQEMIREARALPPGEFNQLLQALLEIAPESHGQGKRSIRELRGLGKDIWAGIDVQDYINQLRAEWDQRP